MSRQTNFCDLNERGYNFIKKNATTEKIMASSRHCPHCNKEIVDYIDHSIKTEYDETGMFGECSLHAYIDKNSGKKFFEYVQESPWSSGPYEFLALRWEDGTTIKETEWTSPEIEEVMGSSSYFDEDCTEEFDDDDD